MSVGQGYQFGGAPFATNGSDLLVNLKSNPGATFYGTETNGTTSEVREIGGSTWLVSNAFYVTALNGFQQYNPAFVSSAVVISPTGVLQQATAAANAPAPIVWTFTNIATSGPAISEYYYIDLYGADPTGTNLSDSAFTAVLAAIAASTTQKGRIIGGAGSYRISAAVALPANVYFEGEGVGTTTITQTNLSASIFTGTGTTNSGISNCTLTYSAAATAKALSFTTCTFVFLEDVSIANYGTAAVWFYNTSNVRMTNVDGIGVTTSTDGYYVTATDSIGFNSNDHHLTNCRFGGPTTSACMNGAAYHLNGCAAVWMTSCDSFNSHNNLQIDPPSGQLVSNLFISNCSFDYATGNSVLIKPTGGACILSSFENVWASGGFNGFDLDTTLGPIDQVQITNLRANNCTNYGVVLNGTGSGNGPTNVSLVNPIILANYVGGISCNNDSQMMVIGGYVGNSPAYSNPPYTNQQQYGFRFTGSNNNITLLGVTFLSTNTTAIFAPGNLMMGVIVRSCPGINNPVGAISTTVATGGTATPVSGTFYVNHTGYDYTMYVSGLNITNCTANSVLTGYVTGNTTTVMGSFDIPVGASWAVTWSGSTPTFAFAAR